MFTNPFVLDILGALARSLLLLTTGYLQRQHVLSPEQSTKLVALGVEHFLIWAPGALAFGWAIWKSYWNRKKLMVAQAAGYPMTENEVKLKLRSGEATPTVTTPKNTVPGVPA